MKTGYSGTPLAKKLGFRPNFIVITRYRPDHYLELFSELPDGLIVMEYSHYSIWDGEDGNKPKPDIVHLFTNNLDELLQDLSYLRNLIKPNGAIWVSWYKKAAKLPTELTEDVIRDAALPLGLVDVKVCAVDEKWSGLKLVIRKENRI
ncbi:MAG: DUF3052 family protein [Chloracidobacterium sp.]|nr:DUF3052 family protein [Chloracidobacterium sp.]